MPGLDEFYRYLEKKQREATSSHVNEAKDARGADGGARALPQPGSDRGVRYIVRGGVTIAVPVDEAAQKGDTPATARQTAGVQQVPGTSGVSVSGVPGPGARPTPKLPTPAASDAAMRPSLPPRTPSSDAEGAALWERLPRHLQILGLLSSDAEPAGRTFEETRGQLIQRLIDPILTLEETARLLDVCPATVRRYANRGQLVHHRTLGQQRRFKLSDVVSFLERRSERALPDPSDSDDD